jgi:hypothetical protein
MTDEEIRLECLKQAAIDERLDSRISDIVARAARYAAFVFGEKNIAVVHDGIGRDASSAPQNPQHGEDRAVQ